MEVSTLIGIGVATLVSEDLASIGAGVLAREGQVPLGRAVVACVAGVYLGDIGLWYVGRVMGQRVLALPWLSRRLDRATISAWSARLDRGLGPAVLASRFLPGSRLPMYLAAGVWGRRPLAFAAWSLLAVVLWTPLLVVLTAVLGGALIEPWLRRIETGVLGTLLTGAAVFAVLTLTRCLGRRARLSGRAPTASCRAGDVTT